jgi:hypothetical protein
MAVHPRRVGRVSAPVVNSGLTGGKLLTLPEDHPVRVSFNKWLGDKPATNRKAREFLRAFPQLAATQAKAA